MESTIISESTKCCERPLNCLTTESLILSHEEAIKTSVDLDTLVPKLFKKRLLTPAEREELLYHEICPNKRKIRLVTILSKKGENAPGLLVECLREETSHLPHTELANSLEVAFERVHHAQGSTQSANNDQTLDQVDLPSASAAIGESY